MRKKQANTGHSRRFWPAQLCEFRTLFALQLAMTRDTIARGLSPMVAHHGLDHADHVDVDRIAYGHALARAIAVRGERRPFLPTDTEFSKR